MNVILSVKIVLMNQQNVLVVVAWIIEICQDLFVFVSLIIMIMEILVVINVILVVIIVVDQLKLNVPIVMIQIIEY